MLKDSISLAKLRDTIIKAGHFKGEIMGKSLVLHNDFKGRQVRTLLSKKDNGKYGLFTEYTYINKISHFTFAEPEIRGTRDKTRLFSIIRKLRKSGVLKYIDTSFLIINTANEHITARKKKDLIKELDDIMEV